MQTVYRLRGEKPIPGRHFTSDHYLGHEWPYGEAISETVLRLALYELAFAGNNITIATFSRLDMGVVREHGMPVEAGHS